MCVRVNEKRTKVVWSSLDRTRASERPNEQRVDYHPSHWFTTVGFVRARGYQALSRDHDHPFTGYTAHARRTLRTWAAGDFPGSASGLLLLIVFQNEPDGERPQRRRSKAMGNTNNSDPRDTLLASRYLLQSDLPKTLKSSEAKVKDVNVRSLIKHKRSI